MIGAANAQSQPAPTNTRATASIEQLKAYYLACDAIMSTRRVDAALAQRCASIGQQVQERAFGGDFDEMIAWWQREREAARAARPKDAA